MSRSSKSPEQSWIERAADQVEAQAFANKGAQANIVCASGISPSGPIHLGNLREIITVHLIVEELRARGRSAEHIHSWDDFDRLRKVPQGVPSHFAQYVGMPLSSIPDPFGVHASYAEHYKHEFIHSIEQLNIFPRYISQTKEYTRGVYREQIKEALRRRRDIFDVLVKYQTLETDEKRSDERREEYYPFKVYCEICKRDTTKTTNYAEAGAVVSYTCMECQHHGSFSLDEKIAGKLVWKVDWPMRWAFERVDFEPGGEDHSSPGSSFTVGKELVAQIFGWQAPYYIGYAFVGMGGRSKISSSLGTNGTPKDALNILEPAILRWLYVRRDATLSFNIDFGKEVLRLYDEWDGLVKGVAAGTSNAIQTKTHQRAIHTSTSKVLTTAHPLPFRFLSSVADITQGNRQQILRIITDHYGPIAAETLDPRLTCAISWATQYQPEDERTLIRTAFAPEVYASLDEEHRACIEFLTTNLPAYWDIDRLTKLVYGTVKVIKGLSIDAEPTEEIKVAQRSFFAALYKLLCSSDTGPRLPTLFLSLGLEKVVELLRPPVVLADV